MVKNNVAALVLCLCGCASYVSTVPPKTDEPHAVLEVERRDNRPIVKVSEIRAQFASGGIDIPYEQVQPERIYLSPGFYIVEADCLLPGSVIWLDYKPYYGFSVLAGKVYILACDVNANLGIKVYEK